MKNVYFMAAKAKEVSARLGLFSAEVKNEILGNIAEALEKNIPEILKANAKDIKAGKTKKMSPSLLDRLLLTEERIRAIARDVRKVATLKDPIGEILEQRELENGLLLKRVRVPLGVIGMIYEARPNVTVDAAVLALKSGNAVVLKGGSDALNSNKALVKIMQDVLKVMTFLEPEARLQDAIQLIDSTDRKATQEMMELHGVIDVIIPRGSQSLINFVRENSKVPVIETGASVVHTYIHEDADLTKAVPIILNAKLRRVSICNALDTVILHEKIAKPFLEAFIKALPKNSYNADHLELKADSASYRMLKGLKSPGTFSLKITKSKPSDYSEEFLDYVLGVKVVSSLEEALMHISIYSLKHSEAIVTENRTVAERFLNAVDAACVYWNTSTQFSDGAQFGLGAEIGTSTQKLHVRGPFALEGLTSYKWVIEGDGQIRI